MNKSFLASTVTLAIACMCWPAHAKDQAVAADAIAGGSKLTKADAARSAQPDPRGSSSGGAASAAYAATAAQGAQPHRQPPGENGESEDGTAARGIEKKDIRRGMVIAKPGTITPHSTQAAPPERGSDVRPERRSRHDPLRTQHDTVKNSIRNVR